MEGIFFTLPSLWKFELSFTHFFNFLVFETPPTPTSNFQSLLLGSTINHSLLNKSNQLCLTRVTSNSLVTDKPVALEFRIELEFRKCWFLRRGEDQKTWRQTSRSKERTKNKLNPHMMPGPGIELGPQWWEVSTLSTAPPLLPAYRDFLELHNAKVHQPSAAC